MEKSEVEVVVVSIGDYSWKDLLGKKLYAFPKGKVGKYFAFYKNGEISYYAKVKSSKEGGKEDVGIEYWFYCMPDADPPYQIVLFDKIQKLKYPIKKDDFRRGRGHIQGRRYTTLKKLLTAKKISELFL